MRDTVGLPDIKHIPFLENLYSKADPSIVTPRAPLISFVANPSLGALAIGIIQLLFQELSYRGKTIHRLEEKEEALKWLHSDRVDHAFSFINICDSFGIDYRAARKRLQALADKKKPKKSIHSKAYSNNEKPKRVRVAVLNPRKLNISTKRERSCSTD